MAVSSVNLNSFSEELVIRNKSGAYIYTVNIVNDFLSSRYWFEVFTLGNYGSNNSGSVFVWNGLKKNMRGENWNSQTTHAVCLNRESAFARHSLKNCFNAGSCLHCLV